MGAQAPGLRSGEVRKQGNGDRKQEGEERDEAFLEMTGRASGSQPRGDQANLGEASASVSGALGIPHTHRRCRVQLTSMIPSYFLTAFSH